MDKQSESEETDHTSDVQPLAEPPRRRRPLATHLLAAVVVLGLILGAGLLVRSSPFEGTATRVASPTAAPGPFAEYQAGGLAVSMHVLIGGPNFLSELLPVKLLLENLTQQPIMLFGPDSADDLCQPPALQAQLSGGSLPSFHLIQDASMSCYAVLRITTIIPGQTLTIRQYLPLTMSGRVTLTAGLWNFAKRFPGAPTISPQEETSPLAGHWPSFQLQVAPRVPPERAISLEARPNKVIIHLPAGANPQVLAFQSKTCLDAPVRGPGLFEEPTWVPVYDNELDQLSCGTMHESWAYVVSAPGYEIVSGSQST